MKILIVDIETTGFLQQNGKIVEIGIIELDLSNGQKKILFDKVTHEPGITIQEVQNSWIVKNSSLTLEEIRHSKPLSFYFDEIQSIIDSYELGITAYNSVFDFDFLENRGFSLPKKLPCPMRIATYICKIQTPRGYKWPKVQEAWNSFFGSDTGYIETHRGADDAFHEADIVYELYKRGEFSLN